MNRTIKGWALLVSAFSVALLLVTMVTPTHAASVHGHVLPPTAKVHGWSLTKAVQETAFFNSSIDANGWRMEDRLPENLPFQMLYTRSGNTFQVKPGTTFYLPISFIDSSPPLIGTYPTNTREARHYFFDSSQFGFRKVKVVIDGEKTAIGPEYVAGPITTKLGYIGSDEDFQYASIGVFLDLKQGKHTVAVHYEVAGTLYLDYLESQGAPREPSITDFGYTVIVSGQHSGH